jgi:Gpi18-like mannosyltransferase
MLGANIQRAAVALRERVVSGHAMPAPTTPDQSSPLPVRVSALPVCSILLQALMWWAAIRGAYLVLVAVAVVFFQHHPLGPQAMLQALDHWDATWYIDIATHGYRNPNTAGFLPLFPLLIAAGAHLPGISPLLSALVIANLASLGAFAGMGLLAASEAGSTSVVSRTLCLLAAYPVAYFFVAPFSEGPFLCATVFAVLAARQGWWRWAALCALLATLTRPTGLALAPALVWEYGRQQGWWEAVRSRGQALRSAFQARTLARGALVALAAPCSLAIVTAFDAVHYGDPFLYIHAQDRYWFHEQWPIWQTLITIGAHLLHPSFSTAFRFYTALEVSALVVVGGVTLANLRRMPVSFSVFVLALLYLILSTPIPSRPEVVPSTTRYLLAAFPFFLILGRWYVRHPRLGLLVVVASFAAQMLLAQLYLKGMWAE